VVSNGKTMSDSAHAEEHDELFWRDEVLKATYWMLGEGIEEAVAPTDLRGFLDAPSGVVEDTFDRLADREYIRGTDRGYVFTEHGEVEAKRRFADEFAGITGFDTSHTDCGPDCWCHDPEHSADECPSEHEHHHAHS
jgi:hypothetical protein